MPELLRSHYPQLPVRLTFDLHTHDLHEAVSEAQAYLAFGNSLASFALLDVAQIIKNCATFAIKNGAVLKTAPILRQQHLDGAN
jgi:hypothetical protein